MMKLPLLVLTLTFGLLLVPARYTGEQGAASASFTLRNSLLAQASQFPTPPPGTPPGEIGPPPSLSQKQRADLLKYNFKQMKKDADQLAEIAQSLRSEISKSNANVLSLDVIRKAKEIEKLSKKIQSAAKGY